MNFTLSSSIHSISADKKLSLPMKILWLILNVINNNLPPKSPNISKHKFIRTFNPICHKREWEEIIEGYHMTPSRALSDMFWKKLPWNLIKEEVENINIFDTGCGNGLYALSINQFSGGINSYKGIDFKQRERKGDYPGWDGLMNQNSFISLKQESSSNVIDHITKESNLLISQSAIEHFNYDLEYFHQLDNFIRKSNNSIIQIHLFPSPACLWLYLLHGVRQYNFRSILKIAKIFESAKSYFRIYPLGGDYANHFHYKYRRVNLKNKNKLDLDLYQEKLKYAIEKDFILKNINNPSFYALIIHSNYKNKIF